MAENSGGFVNYYLAVVEHPQREEQPPYQAECEDIIRALGMTFDEGNVFKETWRRAAARQGRQKLGHTQLRSGEKLKHYATAIHRLDLIESGNNAVQQSGEHPLTTGSVVGNGRVRLHSGDEKDFGNFVTQTDTSIHPSWPSTSCREGV